MNRNKQIILVIVLACIMVFIILRFVLLGSNSEDVNPKRSEQSTPLDEPTQKVIETKEPKSYGSEIETNEILGHTGYKVDVSVKNSKYNFVYFIENATLNNNILSIETKVIKNENVEKVVVLANDQNKNTMKVIQKKDQDKIFLEVEQADKVETVFLKFIPLTKDQNKIKDRKKLDSLECGKSSISIKFIEEYKEEKREEERAKKEHLRIIETYKNSYAEAFNTNDLSKLSNVEKDSKLYKELEKNIKKNNKKIQIDIKNIKLKNYKYDEVKRILTYETVEEIGTKQKGKGNFKYKTYKVKYRAQRQDELYFTKVENIK